MAVKYKREDDTTTARDRLAKAYAPRFLPSDPKQRLVVIYLGLMAATLMLLAAYGLGVFKPASDTAILEGAVTVASKRTVQGDDGTLMYVIEVTAELSEADGASRRVSAPAAIDESAWLRLDPGDRLNARYRWNPSVESISILGLDEVSN